MDAQAGIQYEGEEPPAPTALSNLAFDAFNHLSNGAGGIDWAGLGVVVELLGVADVERLVHDLQVIRHHRPERTDPAPPDEKPEA